MLATYLTKMQSFINGRPLIPISDDVDNMEDLTLNHFFLGRSNPNVNISTPQDNVSNFRTKWKFIQDTKSIFPSLHNEKKWNMNIRNKNLSRANWP